MSRGATLEEDRLGYSRLVHYLAVLLTAAVFPLIWVGGLVTTYGAGMAVPDWPGTYGWNMFLYPPSTWLHGGFDLMVEHGHRLLGSLVGLIAVVLLLASLKWEPRPWFRWWCVLVLAAVVLQGVLGGVRVLLDERLVAMIHGCSAQLFLAIATATALMSSRWWKQQSVGVSVGSSETDSETDSASRREHPATAACKGLAIGASVLLLAAYSQVVAGAQLRHVPSSASPSLFMGFVHMHLLLASIVLLASFWTAWRALVSGSLWGGVKWTAVLILLVVLCQITLGVGTWIVNYALPWQEWNINLSSYTILAKGYWESIVVTAHVACGALIVSLSTLVCLGAWRSRMNLQKVTLH
jgi:heme a synthase